MIYLSITRENDIAARVGLGKLYYNKSYITPNITINEITDGHEVKIKDIYGEHKFTVMNGPQGAQGPAGADGYSPTITSTKSDGTTTLIIQNKDGGEIVQILDGVTGETPHMTVMKDGDTNTITFMTM